jgi:myo-inositol-1(or 4)-monophosphatase
MDLEYIRRIGISAAYKGGQVIRGCYGRLTQISRKGAIDLVTEADVNSEKIIIETIRSIFPDHAILAEESGRISGQERFQWVIDPLDGTINFVHQVGIFCVSIAFMLDGEPTVGVVLNPLTGELFTAVAGKGAELNGRPIRVSDADVLLGSLLVTGFPYDHHTIFDDVMTRIANCLKASRGLRRLGSAALDLCFVACGRFDGFWEQNLKPWDTAAGVIIAREAGASVTDFSNSRFMIDQKQILATNGRIHDEMITLLTL